MNPWSQVEDTDESFERDLFLCRRRALGTTDPPVPPLEAVLRQSQADAGPHGNRVAPVGVRPRQGAARTLTSVCLAAAALLCAARSMPHRSVDHPGWGARDARDGGAAASSVEPMASWFTSDDDEIVCSIDRRIAVNEDPRACIAPAPKVEDLAAPPARPVVRGYPPASQGQALACVDEALCSLAP